MSSHPLANTTYCTDEGVCKTSLCHYSCLKTQVSSSKNSNEGLKVFIRLLLHIKAEGKLSERIQFDILANILADIPESPLPIQTEQCSSSTVMFSPRSSHVRHLQLNSTFTICSSDIHHCGRHLMCPSSNLICRQFIINGIQRICKRCRITLTRLAARPVPVKTTSVAFAR